MGQVAPAEPTAARSSPAQSSPTAGAHVTQITFSVADLDQSAAFFEGLLGATRVDQVELAGADFAALTGLDTPQATALRLTIGDEHIALIQYRPTGTAIRADVVSNDLEFQHIALVARDIDEAHRRVTAGSSSSISDGVQTIPESNAAAAGVRAFYFRDADRHPLELIWFPDDKGAARWHSHDGDLILGIDHTAIAVTDTDASIAFYETMGLEIAGRSFNEGVEQERLSGVSGARVRITGLRGATGMGVEFLQYVAPGPGAPSDVGVGDLAHVETSVWVPNLEGTLATLANAPRVSSRIAACELCVEGTRAFVVRDPDGHAIRIVGD